MEKIDYKKEMKMIYNPPRQKVGIVELPEMKFFTVSGMGNPNTSAQFREAVEALFSLSFAVKFALREPHGGADYTVMPLEGLFHHDDILQEDGTLREKEEWKWTLLIRQPDVATDELVRRAREQVEKKKRLPHLANVRFESFEEGLCAQIMHIGPFSEEKATVEKLLAFIQQNGYEPSGRHHEIYLSDWRRTAPEKMKTIIRQPIKRKGSLL